MPKVPAWAVPRGVVGSDAEAAYMAGSALTVLDNLVRSEPAWAGAWRRRLALGAAAKAAQLLGRTEDESGLRDGWYFRRPGDDPGPAGCLLAGWRRLADRSTGFDAEGLRAVVETMGLTWRDGMGALPAWLADEVAGGKPAPLIASAAFGHVQALFPGHDLLGWWLADLVLAMRMRWPVPVPILGTQMHRRRPGGEGLARAFCLAAASGAAEACALAQTMARRAQRLGEVAPKLRTKGAGEVIGRLLDDDAVPGGLAGEALSRWASRRLFERLLALDAVRELSGRPSFRLFGL